MNSALSVDYREYWSNLAPSHHLHPGNRFRYRLIAGELDAEGIRPRRVLDCGCGDGSLLALVARTIPCGQLHGMDVAGNVPTGRAGVPIEFRQQDLGSPVAVELHGLFDLVLCSEVIEHVPNDKTLLANLCSLTAPGGTVVLTTQSGSIFKTERFLGHLRHYSIQQLCADVAATGLTVQRSFLAGWPWLNMQKIAAHHFQDSVQRNIVQATTMSPWIRASFALLSHLYRFSSRSCGPQIVITARKPV